MLPRSTSLDLFPDNAFKSTYAHATLSVPGQCIVSCKGIPAQASVCLGTGMDLGMSFEIMTSDEALVTMIAPKLPVA